jgi:hypothetical protein
LVNGQLSARLICDRQPRCPEDEFSATELVAAIPNRASNNNVIISQITVENFKVGLEDRFDISDIVVMLSTVPPPWMESKLSHFVDRECHLCEAGIDATGKIADFDSESQVGTCEFMSSNPSIVQE